MKLSTRRSLATLSLFALAAAACGERDGGDGVNSAGSSEGSRVPDSGAGGRADGGNSAPGGNGPTGGGSGAGAPGAGGGAALSCNTWSCEHGTCVESSGAAMCECEADWFGPHCETRLEGETYPNPDLVPELDLIVDRATRHQQYKGLGVGAIFYHNHLLNGIPSAEREPFYDAVFKDVNHQYLMFWIRPTEESNDNDDPMVLDREAFEFDAKYATLIKKAQERDDDITIVATVMTPPAWLKTNRSVKGGGTLDTSVDDAYEEYAEFVFAGLLAYKEMGIEIDALTLTNEPDFSLGHEDASYTPEQAAAVYHFTVDHLKALIASEQNTAGVLMPQIMAPSTLSVTAVDDYVAAFKADGAAWDNTAWVATHQYGGGRNTSNFLAASEVIDDRLFIMSEWHSANEDDVDDEVEEVMEQSAAMITAFRGMVSSYWWFEVGHPHNPYAGLCQTPWGESYTCDKSYDHWRQWAFLTPVDSIRVGTREVSSSADLDVSYVAFDDGSSIVLHLLNRSDSSRVLSLQIDEGQIRQLSRWETGATASYTKQTSLRPVNSDDAVIVSLPARTASSLQLIY